MEPVYAVLEAGLAVAPLLRSSVPERFEIFEGKGGREARLPPLPEFRINLYAPPGHSPAARDLADHVRASFAGRTHVVRNN
jgi:DNA-binding transcriptional LysR family regulator